MAQRTTRGSNDSILSFYVIQNDTVLFESGIGLVGNVYLANAMATIKKLFF